MRIVGKKMFAVAMAATLVFTGTGVNSATSSAATKVTGVSISKTQLSLLKGKTTKLSVAVNPPTLTKTAKVTFKSSNKNIAAVSLTGGNITAKKTGNATITATIKVSGKTFNKICKVTVTNPVTGVTVSSKSKSMNVGDTYVLKATATPKTATNKKVVFVSSNKKVATVGYTGGKITATGAGTATITAQATDGSGKKATMKVTVAEKNLTIDSSDIKNGSYTLSGKAYDNVTISNTVGSAEVNLTGVTIRNTLTLEGGADYTTNANNAVLNKVVVAESGTVKAFASTNTKNPNLIVAGRTNIRNINAIVGFILSGSTTGTIQTVSISKTADVVINTPVSSLVIDKAAAAANIVINAVVAAVTSNAPSVKIEVKENGFVNSVVANGASTKIEGQGTVNNVAVNGNNVIVNTVNTTVAVSENTTGTTVNGVSLAGGTTNNPTPTPTPSSTPTPGTGGNTTNSATVQGSVSGNTTSFALPTSYQNLASVQVNYGATSYTLDSATLTALKGFLANDTQTLGLWNGISQTHDVTFSGQTFNVKAIQGSSQKEVTFTSGSLSGKKYVVNVASGTVTVNTPLGGSYTIGRSGDTTLTITGSNVPSNLTFAVTY